MRLSTPEHRAPWILLGGCGLCAVLYLVSLDALDAVLRGAAVALGVHAMDYGYFAGVVRKRMLRSGMHSGPGASVYTGRAAVRFGWLSVLVGVAVFLAGVLLPRLPS